MFCSTLFVLNNFASAITAGAGAPSPSPLPFATPDAAARAEYNKEFFAKICSGHGGVDCSVINQEGSVVCKDGTLDKNFPFIYGIPECQDQILQKADQDSDFILKSACYPPSELGCTTAQSYTNLLKYLGSVSNSELGKLETDQCRQQMTDYAAADAEYHQCLVAQGRPDFTPTGKLSIPLLKAVFCPIYYGKYSSYEFDLDLCVCAQGYFLNQGQCVQADQICQSIHGSGSYAKDGYCIIPSPPISPVSSTQSKKTPGIITPTPVRETTKLSPSNIPSREQIEQILNISPSPVQTFQNSTGTTEQQKIPSDSWLDSIFKFLNNIFKNLVSMLSVKTSFAQNLPSTDITPNWGELPTGGTGTVFPSCSLAWWGRIICIVKKVFDIITTIRRTTQVLDYIPHQFPFGGPILSSERACDFKFHAFWEQPTFCFFGVCYSVPLGGPVTIPLIGSAIEVGPPTPSNGKVIEFPFITQKYRNNKENQQGPWALGLGFTPFPLPAINDELGKIIIHIPPTQTGDLLPCAVGVITYGAPYSGVCFDDFRFDCKVSGKKDQFGIDIYKVIRLIGTSPNSVPQSVLTELKSKYPSFPWP